MTDNTPTTKQEEGGLLLPCPFCGASPVNETFDDQRGMSFWIACQDCEPSPIVYVPVEEKDAAVTAWNTRAPATPPHNEDGLRKALKQIASLSDDAYPGCAQKIARQALGDIPSG